MSKKKNPERPTLDSDPEYVAARKRVTKIAADRKAVAEELAAAEEAAKAAAAADTIDAAADAVVAGENLDLAAIKSKAAKAGDLRRKADILARAEEKARGEMNAAAGAARGRLKSAYYEERDELGHRAAVAMLELAAALDAGRTFQNRRTYNLGGGVGGPAVARAPFRESLRNINTPTAGYLRDAFNAGWITRAEVEAAGAGDQFVNFVTGGR